MKNFFHIAVAIFVSLVVSCALSEGDPDELRINSLGYFERRGLNILVFSNPYTGGFNDEKNSGIELIHHGVRTLTGGAVRLSNTPEQWDLVPQMTDRKVDSLAGSISVTLEYPDYDFTSQVVVTGRGGAVEIAVHLDAPIPEALVGAAGFNLEFLPSQYWNKTYLMDGRVGLIPRYAASTTITRPESEQVRQYKGYHTHDNRGTGRFIDPLPLDTGRSIVMASDDPERLVKVSCADADIALYDGRMLAQNGWFVLRSLLPAGKTGKVLSWTLEGNVIDGWLRRPNIGFSQVGYLPGQNKVSVIELDKRAKPLKRASVWKVNEAGKAAEVFSGPIDPWGDYHKYHYVKFDFSAVTTPGVYFIKYGEQTTNHFIVGNSVYDKITDATSDIWIPIHMNHMAVNEGYRMWHGEPFKEGYLQVPAPTDHFDMHFQGPTTDTPFRDLQHIPGLNVGGFFDAGDFDIETGANIGVVQNFIQTWEYFRPQRDQTFVSQTQRYVDLHRPDGVPDILQFIEHGTLNLVAQAEILGHMATTLSNSVLDNYHHLGDAASITDGLIYDPRLGPFEVGRDGKTSGRPDDMWAFTSRNPSLDLRAATMFAAASRALRGYNDPLADRALVQSKRLLTEATELLARRPEEERGGPGGWGGRGAGLGTNLELYITTGERQYADRFLELLWPALDGNVGFTILTAIHAIPHMDVAYKERLRPYVVRYKEYVDGLQYDNPYGVPIGLGNWAGSGGVVNFGTTLAFVSREFPDIVPPELSLKAMEWLFGCHPYHNYSFVAALGAVRPKEVFYGNNRADFSFIPGNVAPGLLFRQPDHFENYDDWPFLWGQNEGTIGGNTAYLIFGSVFKEIMSK